jgi:hypothetical protein
MEQNTGYLKLNVRAATLASAITAVIMVVLSLPVHIVMYAHEMRPEMAPGGGPMPHGPGSEMMQPPMWGIGFAGWIIVALLVVIVYSGVAGAIFAAIYNALLPKR